MTQLAPTLVSPSIASKLSRLNPSQRMLLEMAPQKGNGHRELFRDARLLLMCGLTSEEQEQLLRVRFSRYYRQITDREFEDAIANAAGRRSAHFPRWPKPDGALIAHTLRRSSTLQQLKNESPIHEPGRLGAGEVLDRFFRDHEIICMGLSNSRAETEERRWFRGREAEYQFIVPNAMSALIGAKKNGSPSKRCLDNSGPWVIQVVEFDSGTLDHQAALHTALRSRGGRLRMVVFSGGKSLHGWYDLKGWSTDQVVLFRRDAAALGADRMMFTACQFARTPNALRDGEKLQEVVYLS